MYFGNYKNYLDARINPSLLWEYNLEKLDYTKMRNLIVQRIIERGWPEDWFAMLNLYGIEGVKNAVQELPYLNEKDLNFVSQIFSLPLTAFKCYTRKPLVLTHWNS